MPENDPQAIHPIQQGQSTDAQFNYGGLIRLPFDASTRRAIQTLVIPPITVSLPDTTAATAANYGTFFTADRAYRVLSAAEVHLVKGTDGGAVTLNIEKLTGTTAPDSGVTLLSTAFDLKGTINTVQFGSMVVTDATYLKRGDRLCLKDAGTLTAVAFVNVTVYLQTL